MSAILQFTEFLVKIILLFTPGIISLTIIDKLTEDRRHDISHRILYSLVLGFLCYLSYYYLLLLIYETILGGQVAFTFFDSLTTSKPLNFKEIAVVSIYSIFIGYFCAAFINYKILFRFARFIKVSKKISDILAIL